MCKYKKRISERCF